MRGALRKQGSGCGIFWVEKCSGHTRELLVGDHFANVGDVLLDSGDLLRPGNQALIRYSGSVLSFGFDECGEGMLQLLLKGWAGHRGKGITRVGGSACPLLCVTVRLELGWYAPSKRASVGRPAS